MGFEPIIQSDGSWRVGTSGQLTYLDQWRDRPVAYTNSGTRTLDANYWRIVPGNTLPDKRLYLVWFRFDCTGAPWNMYATFTYTTVIQNGESFCPYYCPVIMHADNGSTIYPIFKAGDAYGQVTSGLDVYIAGQDGRFGTWTVYLYDLGGIA